MSEQEKLHPKIKDAIKNDTQRIEILQDKLIECEEMKRLRKLVEAKQKRELLYGQE